MTEIQIGIAIVSYVLLLVAICWREVRIRKRKRAERRQEVEYAAYQRTMEDIHDEQGIQRDGQEVG